MEDLHQILAYIQQRQPRTAAVIGAGNIGLEITEAMHKLKMDVFLFAYAHPYASVWNALISAALKAL